MPRYRITKVITAKTAGQAIRKEREAEIYAVDRLEEKAQPEEKGTANTHAIGFEIRPGNEFDSAD